MTTSTDPSSWPEWYLADVLRAMGTLVRDDKISDQALLKVWHAYVDARPGHDEPA